MSLGIRSKRLRRGIRVAMAALAALSILTVTLSSAAAGTSSAESSSSAPAFSASRTIERTNLADGSVVTVDQTTFSVTVSQITNLRNRQEIAVQWTGAHPTGGLVSDEQSSTADEQEYPVVLMECRGVDSDSVPASQQVSPQTCWTATPDERAATSPQATPIWSLDEYAPAAQRTPLVGVPLPYPASCPSTLGNNQYWVPFVGADGTVYPTGPGGCGGASPDSTNSQDPGIVPSDTTYAASDLNGGGSDNFVIETSETNASLGCSQTVVCSLEIIPIEGISCDPTAALDRTPPDPGDVTYCESDGDYAPGAPGTSDRFDAPVSGSLWYLPSNWRNRVAVPLTFAPPSDICSLVNKSAPLDVYGSELMAGATTQWNPSFCLAANGFNINHVQTAEPEAKNLLNSGGIEAAYQGEPTLPPAGQKAFFVSPTVQAPVAVTGFAISYIIDNGNGQPYTDLKLDPRLLAKLLTESYPGDVNDRDDPGIKNNPLTMFEDPEFKALNPSFVLPPQVRTQPAATLYSILAQSDVIWALTSYINADPEARAWLNGRPDPWGMVVNPAYKGIQLPVTGWQQLDTYIPAQAPNQCLATTPIPIRPLIDEPQETWAQVTVNMQFGYAPSIVDCTFFGTTEQFIPIGAETRGSRFLMGIVPLAAAASYDLDTAALQTYVPAGDPANFSDPGDRKFVAPDDASLKAAAALLQPSAAAGSWLLPYADFPSNGAAAAAYPGTMLMSMDLPARGLPKGDAADFGRFVSFAVTSGQTPGTSNGQLPPGYLPLTAANGLGNEVAYSKAAAADVTAQNGQVPPLVAGPPPRTPVTTTTVASTQIVGSTTFSTGAGLPSNPTASGAGSPRETQPAVPPTTGSRAASPGGGPMAVVGKTIAVGSGAGGMAIPAAFALMLLGGVGGLALSARRKRRAGR